MKKKRTSWNKGTKHKIGYHGAVGIMNSDGSRTCAECGKKIKDKP